MIQVRKQDVYGTSVRWQFNLWLSLAFVVVGLMLTTSRIVVVNPTAPLTQPQQVAVGEVPEGLTVAEWGHLQNMVSQAEYEFVWHEATDSYPDGYHYAPNRVQGWQTAFTQQGAQVTPRSEADWSWGLTLTGYGYAGDGWQTMTAVTPALQTEKNRLTYQWQENLSEWWINTEQGLEQGFTLLEHPPLQSPTANLQSPLILEMAITGNLTPQLLGETIAFADVTGATVLTYGKLLVIDANRLVIPAHFQITRSEATQLPNYQLQILVDDTHATYPLTIDPWVETAKLIASDATAGDNFGSSVAVSGDTVVVGALLDDDGGTNSGSAYVFVRPGGGWLGTLTESAKLIASDAATGDELGRTVGVSGETVVVGSAFDDDGGSDSGSAYVFVRPAGGWAGTLNESAKLIASDDAPGDNFGRSVMVSGDTVVVGSAFDDDGGSNSGSAYVFVRPGGGWAGTLTESAKLIASDDTAGDQFGRSVAVSGETVVVGAFLHDEGSTDSGSAYVFVRPGGGWAGTLNESAKLIASDTVAGDQFGRSVAVSGETVVVSTPLDDDGGNASGSAYVFVRPGGGWVGTLNESAKLTASDDAAGDNFGWYVGVSGDTVVVGTPFDDDGGNNSGSAYVFVRPGGGWTGTLTESAKFIASDDAADDNFGLWVGVSGDTVVVGALSDDDGGSNSGSAYIFQNSFCSRQSGNWDSANTWVGGVVPGSTDDACISTGDRVTLSANAAANQVLVNPNAALDLSTFGLTAEESVTNNGIISQTMLVAGSSNAEFLHIQDIAASSTAYRGVLIDPTVNNQNLGVVNVGVRETIDWFGWYNGDDVDDTQFCTIEGSNSPTYAQRCYTIEPASQPAMAVAVRLWGLSNELNGIAEGSLAVYRNNPAGSPTWVELITNASTGNDGGSYSYAQADTPGFSRFLLGAQGQIPTAVTLQRASGDTMTPVVILLLVLMAVLFSWRLVRRLASGKR